MRAAKALAFLLDDATLIFFGEPLREAVGGRVPIHPRWVVRADEPQVVGELTSGREPVEAFVPSAAVGVIVRRFFRDPSGVIVGGPGVTTTAKKANETNHGSQRPCLHSHH